MNVKLSELSRISQTDIRSSTLYWAKHSDIYEKVYSKVKNRNNLKIAYKKLLNIASNSERKNAITFFYRIRRDELDGVLALEIK